MGLLMKSFIPAADATLAVFGKSIRRHGENGDVSSVRELTNFACGFEAVHPRHLHVHENEIVDVFTRQGQRGEAVFREVEAKPGIRQRPGLFHD